MAKASLTLEMKAREAGYRDAIKRAEQLQTGFEQKLKKLTETSKKAGDEQRRFGQEAKRAYTEIRGPQEAYDRRMKALNLLLKEGKIKQEEYGQAAKRAGDRLQRAGQHGQRAFGGRALSDLKSYAAGLVGIGTLIAGVTRLFMALETEKREAAEGVKESRRGLGSLAQLAKSPADMKRLVQEARLTVAEGGAEDMAEAGGLVFALASAGALKHRKMFARARALGVIEEPGEMAGAARKMVAGMGQQETGGIRAMVSKAIGASRYAPAKAPEVLEAASKSAASAGLLELSDEEVMAAAGVLAEIKGPEMAGTYLAQMMRTLKEKGKFKGKSLQESLTEIGGMKLSQADLKKWFGRAQGMEAYELLARRQPKYQELLGNVREAERTDAIGRKLGIAKSDPMVEAAQGLAVTTGKEKVQLEGAGIARVGFETELSHMRQRLRQRYGRVAATAAYANEWLWSWVDTEEKRAAGLRRTRLEYEQAQMAQGLSTDDFWRLATEPGLLTGGGAELGAIMEDAMRNGAPRPPVLAHPDEDK